MLLKFSLPLLSFFICVSLSLPLSLSFLQFFSNDSETSSREGESLKKPFYVLNLLEPSVSSFDVSMSEKRLEEVDGRRRETC